MSVMQAALSPLDILKPDCQPIRLGPFLVGGDGLLRPVDPGRAAAFSVRWRGRAVRATLEAAEAGEAAALSIQTALGRVPSTALAGGAAARREQAFGLVRGLPAHLPRSWRVRLLPDHRIGVEARVGLVVPVSASELVASVISFLLGLAAYFDLLEEAGAGFVTSPGEGAGTAKTCPG